MQPSNATTMAAVPGLMRRARRAFRSMLISNAAVQQNTTTTAQHISVSLCFLCQLPAENTPPTDSSCTTRCGHTFHTICLNRWTSHFEGVIAQNMSAINPGPILPTPPTLWNYLPTNDIVHCSGVGCPQCGEMNVLSNVSTTS